MSTIDITKDLESKTMTVSVEWDAPIDEVWKLWADPRQLERWFGPPGYPLTVTAFDLTPGGRAAYHMTSPEGEEHHGWWRFLTIDAPTHLKLEDGFANDDGTPRDDLPVTVMEVTLSDLGPRTRMTTVTTWSTEEAMAKTIEMGVEEGLKASMSQIPAILAEPVEA